MLLIFPKNSFANSVVINEFSSASNPEWVEIYNKGSETINLAGWNIIFDDNSNTQKVTLTSDDVLPSGEFKVVEHPYTGTNGWLSNSGDTIILKDSSGVEQDSMSYGDITGANIEAPNSDQSAGRNVDGSGDWLIFTSPTKETTNNVATPTPAPTMTPSPTPTPVPSSASTSTPTPTPTSSPSPSPTPSLTFLIFNFPAKINSNQSFSVKVNLSLPNNPNSQIYLKGAFKKEGSSNYFGLTKVENEWVKNGSSYKNQLSIKTDSSGNWNGEVDIKVDTSDSGFTGSSDYLFKVGRYFQDSSGVSWSNETSIYIENQTALNDDAESFKGQEEEEIIDDNSSEKTSLGSKTNLYKIDAATIAGVSIEDNSKDISETSVRTDKRHNPVLIILGVGLILVSGVLLFYNRFKDRIRFPSW